MYGGCLLCSLYPLLALLNMKPHVLIIKLLYRAWAACAVIDDIGHRVCQVINRFIFSLQKTICVSKENRKKSIRKGGV